MANGNDNDQNSIREEKRASTTLSPSEMASAAELSGFSPAHLDQAFSGARQAYDRIYGPSKSTFSDEDYQEMLRVTNRYQELIQPLRQPTPIGGGIPGNEFSLSLRGVQAGVTDLITGLQESRRQKELFGDPEKRQQISGEVSRLKTASADLQEQAKKLRQGQPVPAMYDFIEQGQEPDDEKIAAAMEEQAKMMADDARALGETISQYEGVAGRRQELEAERAGQKETEAFRREFIQTFGQNAYDATVKQIQTEQTQQNMLEREEVRHKNMMKRQRQAQAASFRAALQKASLDQGEVKDTPGPKLLGNDFQPSYVKKVTKSYKKDIQKLRDDLHKEFTGGFGPIQPQEPGKEARATPAPQAAKEAFPNIPDELLPSDQKLILQRLDTHIDYIDQIDQQADFWSSATFKELPSKYFPSEGQIEEIEAMRNNGIPTFLIEIYKEYNRISFDQPPPLPGGNSSQPGNGGAFQGFE